MYLEPAVVTASSRAGVEDLEPPDEPVRRVHGTLGTVAADAPMPLLTSVPMLLWAAAATEIVLKS